jgi:hypothetical protein
MVGAQKLDELSRGEDVSLTPADALTVAGAGVLGGGLRGGLGVARQAPKPAAPKGKAANQAAQAANAIKESKGANAQATLTQLSTGQADAGLREIVPPAAEPSPVDNLIASRAVTAAENRSPAAKERILQQLVDDVSLAEAKRAADRIGVEVNSDITERARRRVLAVRREFGDDVDGAIQNLTTRIEESTPPPVAEVRPTTQERRATPQAETEAFNKRQTDSFEALREKGVPVKEARQVARALAGTTNPQEYQLIYEGALARFAPVKNLEPKTPARPQPTRLTSLDELTPEAVGITPAATPELPPLSNAIPEPTPTSVQTLPEPQQVRLQEAVQEAPQAQVARQPIPEIVGVGSIEEGRNLLTAAQNKEVDELEDLIYKSAARQGPETGYAPYKLTAKQKARREELMAKYRPLFFKEQPAAPARQPITADRRAKIAELARARGMTRRVPSSPLPEPIPAQPLPDIAPAGETPAISTETPSSPAIKPALSIKDRDRLRFLDNKFARGTISAAEDAERIRLMGKPGAAEAGFINTAAIPMVGGSVAGGATGYFSVEKQEGETEEEFEARRIMATLGGVVGGTIAGSAASSIARSRLSMPVKPADGPLIKKLAATEGNVASSVGPWKKLTDGIRAFRGKNIAASDVFRSIQRDILKGQGLAIEEGSVADVAAEFDRAKASHMKAARATANLTNVRDALSSKEHAYSEMLLRALRIEDYAKNRVANQAELDASLQAAQAEFIAADQANKSLKKVIRDAENAKLALAKAKTAAAKDPAKLPQAQQAKLDYDAAAQKRDDTLALSKKLGAAQKKLKQAENDIKEEYDLFRTGSITEQEAPLAVQEMRAKILRDLGPDSAKNIEDSVQNFSGVMDWNLRQMQDAGMLSAQQVADIKAKNDFYAPFNVLREEPTVGPAGYGSFGGTEAVVKARKGINRDDFKLADIFETARQRIYNSTQRMEANKFLRDTFGKLVDDDVNGVYFRRVKSDHSPRPGHSVVSYFDDGEKMFVEVPNDVALTINGSANRSAGVLTPLRWTNAVARLGQAALSPTFAAGQFTMLDPIRAQTMSNYRVIKPTVGVKLAPALALAWHYPRALFSATRLNLADQMDGLVDSAIKNNAMPGSFFMDVNPKTFERRAPLSGAIGEVFSPSRVLSSFIDVPVRGSSALEQTTKLVGWQQALMQEKVPVVTNNGPTQVTKYISLKKAMTDPNVNPDDLRAAIARASYDVANYYGSPNFAKKAADLNSLSMFYTFANAAIRSIETDARRAMPLADFANMVAGKPYDKQRVKSALSAASVLGQFGLVTAGVMALNYLPENREDYEELSDRWKTNGIAIPLSEYTFPDGSRKIMPAMPQETADYLGIQMVPYKTFSKEEGRPIREYFRVRIQGPHAMLARDMAEATVKQASSENPGWASVAEDFLWRHSPINIEGETLMERGRSLISSMQPGVRLIPELMTNTSLYDNRPVVSANPEASPGKQFDPNKDPEFYRQLAGALPESAPNALRSPQSLRYITESFFGGARLLNAPNYREGSIQDKIPILGAVAGRPNYVELGEKRDEAKESERVSADITADENAAVEMVLSEMLAPSNDPELARRAEAAMSVVAGSERAAKRLENRLESAAMGTSSEARMVGNLRDNNAKAEYYARQFAKLYTEDMGAIMEYVGKMSQYGKDVINDEVFEAALLKVLQNQPESP